MKVRSSWCPPPVCARPARPLRCFVRCRGTAHHLRQVRHTSWLLSRERSGVPLENDQLAPRKAPNMIGVSQPRSRIVLGLHMVVCLPMAASSPSSRSAPPTLVTTARSTLPGTCRLLTAARRALPRTVEAEREEERPPLRSNRRGQWRRLLVVI